MSDNHHITGLTLLNRRLLPVFSTLLPPDFVDFFHNYQNMF